MYLVLYNIFQYLSNPWESFDFLLHFTHMSQMSHIFIILESTNEEVNYRYNEKLSCSSETNSKIFSPYLTFLPWSSTCKSAIFLWTEDNSLKTLIKSSPFSPFEDAKLCKYSSCSVQDRAPLTKLFDWSYRIIWIMNDHKCSSDNSNSSSLIHDGFRFSSISYPWLT